MVKKERQLHLYRETKDGKRLRCVFTVDERMTILSEECEEAQEVFGPGVEHKNGTTIVREVSNEDQEALGFFVETRPCWFKGCEELRREYQEELKKAGGTQCTGCAKGAVMRKFLPRVKDAIKQSKNT